MYDVVRMTTSTKTRAEVFAEWLQRQGMKVLRTPSSYWYETVPHVYQAFPYHWQISPDKAELDNMFSTGTLALRYSTPLESPLGAVSYHVVYEQSTYDIRALRSNARGHVRKGLSIATVEPISFEKLGNEGWELRRDTLIRQGREQAESESWWKNLCLTAKGLPGFEAWGALVQGKLVAALLAFDYEDYFSILYQQSRSDYLRCGVNNALTHVVTGEVVGRNGPRVLFYGLHSLDAPASVDEFKFQMRYIPRPVRQRVEFHAFFRPFVSRAMHTALQLGSRLLHGSSLITKAEGMVRFYLQGKLPPSRQAIPDVLRDHLSAKRRTLFSVGAAITSFFDNLLADLGPESQCGEFLAGIFI